LCAFYIQWHFDKWMKEVRTESSRSETESTVQLGLMELKDLCVNCKWHNRSYWELSFSCFMQLCQLFLMVPSLEKVSFLLIYQGYELLMWCIQLNMKHGSVIYINCLYCTVQLTTCYSKCWRWCSRGVRLSWHVVKNSLKPVWNCLEIADTVHPMISLSLFSICELSSNQ
jgi:hypothetical protein